MNHLFVDIASGHISRDDSVFLGGESNPVPGCFFNPFCSQQRKCCIFRNTGEQPAGGAGRFTKIQFCRSDSLRIIGQTGSGTAVTVINLRRNVITEMMELVAVLAVCHSHIFQRHAFFHSHQFCR